MQETGTLPPPYTPTEREKFLARRLLDDAAAIEEALPDVAAATRQLAMRHGTFAPSGLDEEAAAAYLLGVSEAFRRCAVLAISRPIQGIA